jgi:hypothetical protein
MHRYDPFQPRELPSQTLPGMVTVVEQLQLGDIQGPRIFKYLPTAVMTLLP